MPTTIREVPRLHDLCCDFISDTIINLENCVFILDFADTHLITALKERAMAFIIASWPSVAERYPAVELEAALGAELYAARLRDQAAVDAEIRRNRLVGEVVEVAPPAAASAPLAAPPAAPPAPTPSAAPRRRTFGGGGDKCAACGKTVYAAELISPCRGVALHTQCFRCSRCQCKLGMHTFERDEAGALYCKAHFAQARAEHGQAAQVGERAAASDAAPSLPAQQPAPPPPVNRHGVHRPPTLVGAWVAHRSKRCQRCEKTVYDNECISVEVHAARGYGDDLHFHRACFRCEDCGTQLRQGGTHELLGTTLLCRVHFAARRALGEGGPPS